MAPSTCQGRPGQAAAATASATGCSETDIPEPASRASAASGPTYRTPGESGTVSWTVSCTVACTRVAGVGAPTVPTLPTAPTLPTVPRPGRGPVGPPSAAEAATSTELAVVVGRPAGGWA